MDNVQPMDGLDFLSLAVTAVVSYLVLFLLTKLVGNKQISQMTMFDYISGISVGSIAAEMATEPESPLRPLTGMVVYGLLAWGIALWTNKSLAARRAFTGKPLILYDGGTLYREHLKRAKLDLSEFLTLCRAGGWFDLSQLETVVFEHNGNLSFLPREAYRAAQPTDLSLSPKQSVLMTPVIMDGEVLPENLRSVGKDEVWLTRKLREQGYSSLAEVKYAVLETSGQLSILPWSAQKPPTAAQLGRDVKDDVTLPVVLINDGRVLTDNLRRCGKDSAWLRDALRREHLQKPEEAFLLTLDEQGATVCIRKKEDRP